MMRCVMNLLWKEFGVQMRLREQGAPFIDSWHLARAVVGSGYARTISEVFDRWFPEKRRGRAFFPDVVSMIQQIKDHGGFAFGHTHPSKASRHVERLKKEGLDGPCFSSLRKKR